MHIFPVISGRVCHWRWRR